MRSFPQVSKLSILLFLLLFAGAGSGCLSVQKVLNAPFLHVDYARDGVKVWDIHHHFSYHAGTNTETIKVGRRLSLVDNECDGRVDRVDSGKEEFQRGEAGTEKLFERADEKWRTVRTYLMASWFRSRRAGMLRRSPEMIVEGLN